LNRSVRTMASLIIVLLGVAGCGSELLDARQPSPTPETTTAPPDLNEVQDAQTDVMVELWYSKDGFLERNVASVRVGEFGGGDDELYFKTFQALFIRHPPRGLSSLIPVEEYMHVAWGIYDIEDGLGRVRLPMLFDADDDSESLRLRAARVVFTATQFEGIERVLFSIDGEPGEHLGEDGVDLSKPLSRSDFADLVAAVPRKRRGE
jgi:spore germination protein GerM